MPNDDLGGDVFTAVIKTNNLIRGLNMIKYDPHTSLYWLEQL